MLLHIFAAHITNAKEVQAHSLKPGELGEGPQGIIPSQAPLASGEGVETTGGGTILPRKTSTSARHRKVKR